MAAPFQTTQDEAALHLQVVQGQGPNHPANNRRRLSLNQLVVAVLQIILTIIPMVNGPTEPPAAGHHFYFALFIIYRVSNFLGIAFVLFLCLYVLLVFSGIASLPETPESRRWFSCVLWFAVAFSFVVCLLGAFLGMLFALLI